MFCLLADALGIATYPEHLFITFYDGRFYFILCNFVSISTFNFLARFEHKNKSFNVAKRSKKIPGSKYNLD